MSLVLRVAIFSVPGVNMKWFKDYILHANWRTPWGLFFSAKANGKLLEELPGYNEINHENKRLAVPACLYLFIFIVIYYAIILSIGPIRITEYCYSAETGKEIECPLKPIAGLCEDGQILIDRDDEWWCIDPDNKQLSRK